MEFLLIRNYFSNFSFIYLGRPIAHQLDARRHNGQLYKHVSSNLKYCTSNAERYYSQFCDAEAINYITITCPHEGSH